jgi:hypothetical protein
MTAPVKPHILGAQSPPPDHGAYAFSAPEGEWTGCLDYLRASITSSATFGDFG